MNVTPASPAVPRGASAPTPDLSEVLGSLIDSLVLLCQVDDEGVRPGLTWSRAPVVSAAVGR